MQKTWRGEPYLILGGGVFIIPPTHCLGVYKRILLKSNLKLKQQPLHQFKSESTLIRIAVKSQ